MVAAELVIDIFLLAASRKESWDIFLKEINIFSKSTKIIDASVRVKAVMEILVYIFFNYLCEKLLTGWF